MNEKPKKRKVGRPRKRKTIKKRGPKRKQREFEETRVGFFLKHEAPLEYELIYNRICGNKAPTADLIEQVGYSSLNPLFKKPKFRKALIEYREHGLYCGKRRVANADIELYYIELRKNYNNSIRST